jgi:electron transport complex protein RnfG
MKKSILVPIITIVASALLLFGVSTALKGVTEANAAKAKLWHMQTILPGSVEFVEEEYSGDDANIRAAYKAENGYVVETVVYGYAGNITMLVGVNNDGYVTGMVVTDLQETFGLGAEALTDHVFLAQFLNTPGELEVGTDVDAITGATVTSKAIAKSINSAVAYVTGADIATGATEWGG